MKRVRSVSMWGIVLGWAATRCCVPALAADGPNPPSPPINSAGGELAEPAPPPPAKIGQQPVQPTFQPIPEAQVIPAPESANTFQPVAEPVRISTGTGVPQSISGQPTPAQPSNAPAEVVKERYPNKQIAIERQVTRDAKNNYINHGSWTMWDPDGRTICQGDFFNGKAVGKWTRVFHQGGDDPYVGPEYDEFSRPFKAEATYSEDRLVGAWTLTDSQGKMIHTWEFNDDKLNGKAVAYFVSGKPRTEAVFQNGLLDGEALEFDVQGNKISSTAWQAGRRIGPTTQRYPSGAKYSEGEYFFAREDKEVVYDFFKGTIRAEKLAKKNDDHRNGHWIWWYEDGEKMCEGDFADGKAVGHHTWFHGNGQKEMEGDFVEGKRHGMWTTWYAGGQKKSEGLYEAGREVGQWFTWKEDGKVLTAVAHQPPRSLQGVTPVSGVPTQLAPGQYVIQGQPGMTQGRPRTVMQAMPFRR